MHASSKNDADEITTDECDQEDAAMDENDDSKHEKISDKTSCSSKMKKNNVNKR